MAPHLGFVFGIIPQRRLYHTNDESFIVLKSENILFFNRKYYNPLNKRFFFFFNNPLNRRLTYLFPVEIGLSFKLIIRLGLRLGLRLFGLYY